MIYDWSSQTKRSLGEVRPGTQLFFKPDGSSVICEHSIAKVFDPINLTPVAGATDERCWTGRIGSSQVCASKGRYGQDLVDCSTRQEAFSRLSLSQHILAIDGQKKDVFIRTQDGRLEVIASKRWTPAFPGKSNDINSFLFASDTSWIQAVPDSLNVHIIKSQRRIPGIDPGRILEMTSNKYRAIDLNPTGLPLLLVGEGQILKVFSLNAGVKDPLEAKMSAEIELFQWIAADRIAVVTKDGVLAVLNEKLQRVLSITLPEGFLSVGPLQVVAQLEKEVFALAGSAGDSENVIILIFKTQDPKPFYEFHSKRVGFSPAVASVQTMAFSKDAQKLLIGFHINAIILLDLQNSTLDKPAIVKLGDPQDTVFTTDFFPGDRSAYHMSWDGTVALHALDGSNPTYLPTVQPLSRGRYIQRSGWFMNYSSEQMLEILRPTGESVGRTVSPYDMVGVGSDNNYIYLLFKDIGLVPITLDQTQYLPRLCEWLKHQAPLSGIPCKS
ncbi:MAG TPA: hypothetical protein VE954_38195 [Oligoflexus sp.]|uniref:hypothetical protein n=1 Tax=Oligoflexus sp. TaxID=1971216 RepID=UPI002D2908CD|nr:hypothetical protein [Oligoflexus sp.]HYX38971.1 hypothetical protein [Oligoflexus sp.]